MLNMSTPLGFKTLSRNARRLSYKPRSSAVFNQCLSGLDSNLTGCDFEIGTPFETFLP